MLININQVLSYNISIKWKMANSVIDSFSFRFVLEKKCHSAFRRGPITHRSPNVEYDPTGNRHRSTRPVSSCVLRRPLVMVALCNRANHYIFALWFLSFFFFFLSSFFLSSPNLSSRRLDVYHTSTHGVDLVRIYGLKPAARGSLEMQDAKKSPKIAIWAPSHNFDGLYLRN